MADYRLDRLNHREFEHLTQSLCKKFIAIGFTPFGDGPDGGREATFDGLTNYPAGAIPWSGYTVVQCKFRQRVSENTETDTDWAISQIKKELKKFKKIDKNDESDRSKELRSPKNYLFVTNVVLTPMLESGGQDKCQKILREICDDLKIVNCDIWGFDDICRYLDLSSDLRKAYGGFILPGDVLQKAIGMLGISENNFEKILAKYIQKEIKSDYAAKLQSAGQYDENEVPLSSVFLDIPFDFDKNRAFNPSSDHKHVVDFFLDQGDRVISLIDNSNNGPLHSTDFNKNGRFAVVGGPGQGKSTIGQYLCQLYRVEIFQTFPSEIVDPSVRAIVNGLTRSFDGEPRRMPLCRRFPFRIVLNSFATDLANDETLTITEYIRKRLIRLGSVADISLNELQKWISGYPWVFILDGLDEVPSSSNRAPVLEAIENFLIDLAANEADVLVITTTRPQGYSEDLASAHFTHLYLAPLNAQQALTYGSSLLKHRSLNDDDRYELAFRRLKMAADNVSTLKLMSSPLQVTIMATLVERLGEPPKQRYRLFAEYYRTIYDREVSREGTLSRLLNDRKTDIDIIHHRTGLLLQAASENAGDTAAMFGIDDFMSLVEYRLINELGETKEKSSQLIREIKISALDRLVFLVSPKNDSVGFEIRSLQEFMAAEAIYKADDLSVVVKRIDEIGAIDHWRNVLLFFVGKCFQEDNNPLLDRILVHCEELNDINPQYSAVKWGSQVALEILVDGVARNNPRRERRLCMIALELLDCESHDYSAEIVAVYHEGISDIYQEKINLVLLNSRITKSVNTWKVIQGLGVKGVVWAREKFEFHWNTLAPLEKNVVLDRNLIVGDGWLLQKAIGLMPLISPHEAFSLFSDERAEEQYLNFSTIPDWANVVINGDWVDFLETETSRVTFKFDSIKGPILGRFQSLRYVEKNKFLDIEYIPFVHKDWAPYVSLAKFLRNPSKTSLAVLLNSFAERNCVKVGGIISEWNLPWIVLLFIRLADSSADLTRYADEVFNGVYGDIEDWQTLESSVLDKEYILDFEFSSFEEKFSSKRFVDFPIEAMTFQFHVVQIPEISDLMKGVLNWNKCVVSKLMASNLVRYISNLTNSQRSQGVYLEVFDNNILDLLDGSLEFSSSRDLRFFDMFKLEDAFFESVLSFVYDKKMNFTYLHQSRRASWISEQWRRRYSVNGISRELAMIALWLAGCGGLPGVAEEDVRTAVSMGWISQDDRFILKLGSKDFGLNDALSVLNNLPDEPLDGQSGYFYFGFLSQMFYTFDEMNEKDRLALCLGLVEKMKNNVTLIQGNVFSLFPIFKIIEKGVRSQKTCFSRDKYKLKEFGFPVI